MSESDTHLTAPPMLDGDTGHAKEDTGRILKGPDSLMDVPSEIQALYPLAKVIQECIQELGDAGIISPDQEITITDETTETTKTTKTKVREIIRMWMVLSMTDEITRDQAMMREPHQVGAPMSGELGKALAHSTEYNERPTEFVRRFARSAVKAILTRTEAEITTGNIPADENLCGFKNVFLNLLRPQ